MSSPGSRAIEPGANGRGTRSGLPAEPRSPLAMAIAGAVAVLFFVLFVALGTWQVQRRARKLDLIARVEQRVHAPAVPAPRPAQWPNVTAATDEYRHVTATGTFLDASQTLVQAVTDLGAGYWVLTPLQAEDGSVVLVNRGFIPADDRDRVQPAAAKPASANATAGGDAPPAVTTPGGDAPPAVRTPGGDAPPAVTTPGRDAQPAASTITGLLRMPEPGGAFLRHNNPAANQWYSRDVQAIAAARGLTHVAPYFIDAEAPPHDDNGATSDVDAHLSDTTAAARAPMRTPPTSPRRPPTQRITDARLPTQSVGNGRPPTQRITNARLPPQPVSSARPATQADTNAADGSAAGPGAAGPAPAVPAPAVPAAAGPGADGPGAGGPGEAGRRAVAVVSAAAVPGPGLSGGAVVPTPGLTVIHFHNSHLVYAITWYTLALMTAIGIPLGLRKP